MLPYAFLQFIQRKPAFHDFQKVKKKWNMQAERNLCLLVFGVWRPLEFRHKAPVLANMQLTIFLVPALVLDVFRRGWK